MNKKLFVFDIDGTLLTSNKEIAKSTRDAVNKLKERGHEIMLATGRSKYQIQDFLTELSITNYIVCNGSAAFLNHQQIFNKTLEKNSLRHLAHFFRKKNIDLILSSLDGMRRISSLNLDNMETVLHSLGAEVPQCEPEYINGSIYQALGFYAEDFDNKFENRYLDFNFIRWHANCVDITPKDSSKGQSIKEAAKILNIHGEDIIAFGNGNNDIDMLTQAGIGIAMGNSGENVKNAANFVTANNDEDGIFQALNNIGII